MRTDMQALPSRTARQRLLEAERSLAELDAIYSAQNRNAEAQLNIPGTYSESHKQTARLMQRAWRERQLRRAMEAERRPFLELIGLPALSWRSRLGEERGRARVLRPRRLNEASDLLPQHANIGAERAELVVDHTG